MKQIYLRISSTGKIYSLKTSLSLNADQSVLVETDQIIEEGIVIKNPDIFEEGTGTILRKTTQEDSRILKNLKIKARDFLDEARKKVGRHGLGMQILDAELSFDQKKLTFYFSASSRIDFRSLVSDMVRSFGKLIRLQQVGARDEAKFYGGIGKCGRELCCSKFLNNLESITIEMAQVQELATAGSAKLSGCCGKLMCCLAFEVQNYEGIKKKMPKIGSDFKSSQGSGKVVGYNVLEGKVIIEQGPGKRIEVIV